MLKKIVVPNRFTFIPVCCRKILLQKINMNKGRFINIIAI